MPSFGAHMSVNGGLARAVARAVLHECDALQIFTRNASQWRSVPLADAQVLDFRRAVDDAALASVVSHASYLINLGTADQALRQKSLDALADEVDRAEALGLAGVVLHPGSATTRSPDDALAAVSDGLRDVLRARPSGRTRILIENTAGQGTALGARFEELAAILDGAEGHPRLGICLDTCHLLAAGYDIATPSGYASTFDAFTRLVGRDRLAVFHLNDSKKPLGSRVDRHEQIGQGCIGLEPFGWLVNDPRFAGLPMILETPKADTVGAGPVALDAFDQANLDALRRLVASHA